MLVIALVAMFGASGCAFVRAPVVPPMGYIYQKTKAPLDADFDNSKLGKPGKASVQNVLFLVSWGDGSTEAAARQGGISTITHANWELFNVLCVYSRYTTVVYGN